MDGKIVIRINGSRWEERGGEESLSDHSISPGRAMGKEKLHFNHHSLREEKPFPQRLLEKGNPRHDR